MWHLSVIVITTSCYIVWLSDVDILLCAWWWLSAHWLNTLHLFRGIDSFGWYNNLRTIIHKSQPNSLITSTFRSHHETFIRRSWYSVLPDLDVTINCGHGHVVVGMTRRHESWWGQLSTESCLRPFSWYDSWSSHQDPEEPSTSFFWWRSRDETETSR